VSAIRRAALFDAYPHLYGGGQRIGHLVARSMRERGWEVTTVVPARGPLTEHLEADGLAVEVVPVPAALGRYGRTTTGVRAASALGALPGYWRALRRRLDALAPAVVHVSDGRGIALAGLPARRSGARVVWHVHAQGGSRALNSLGSRLSHRVLVPASSALDGLPGVVRARARVVPNPLPAGLLDRPLASLPHEPRLVTVGRLHPDKGLDVLVEAMARVRREVPAATLRIVGGAQEGYEGLPADLEARAAARGLADAVELAGAVADPTPHVAAARCYVQASRTETFGLAVLEAMAIGTPVVATAVGGVADLVRDGHGGLLVAPEDPAALAAAVVRVLRDDDLAAQLRAGGRALASSPRFEPSAFADAVAAAWDGADDG
jgi:glycosyltransferase involved in cell wall biosynthesis